MANFPANCNIGDTYYYDLPALGVIEPTWVQNNSLLIGIVTADTLIAGGSPVAYRNSSYAFALSVIRSAGMVSVAPIAFTTFQFVVNFDVKQRGTASGSFGTGYIQIGTNVFIQTFIGATNLYGYSIGSFAGGTDILAQVVSSSAVGTQPFDIQFSHTWKITRATPTSSIINIYHDGVLLVANYDTGVSGAKTLYMQPLYYNNTADWDSGANGHKVNYSFSNLYLIGSAFSGACLGPTPDAFPERANSDFAGNPAACVLGKKTSYFLDEFNSSTIPVYWNAIQGTYYTASGYATLPTSTPSAQVMELKWVGKLLNFDPADTLTLQIAGRLDTLNLGTGTSGYDAFGIKFFFPDLANWILIKLQRDPTNPLVYRVRVSESFGSERTILTPAFSAYPLEMILRLDISITGVIYYVDGVNVSSVSLPGPLIGVSYVLPSVFVGCDNVHRGYLYYFYVTGSPGFLNLCEGPDSTRIASYRNMLINLLPLGMPWRNLNQVFRVFLTAFATEINRVHTRSDDLLRESNPETATVAELLPEWENMALLSDELPVGTETEAERQAVVAAKVTTDYSGQSRQFFIDLAASLGFIIEIQENGISASARTGTARTGTSRVGSALNIFVWNIRILMDAFAAATAYWTYDTDVDFTTYPGSVTIKAGSFSTDLTFVGGPLSPAFPVVPLSASYPLKFRFQLRTFFYGAVNRSFAIITFSEAADFSTDFVSFIFGYLPASPAYSIDVSGTKAGAPWSDFDLIPATHTDPLYETFDILITISTTGFQIDIPGIGYTYTGTGFVFPNIRFLDINLQRADASNFSVLDGARIYTDEPDPASPISKFQAMVERLKPSHTQVTYT